MSKIADVAAMVGKGFVVGGAYLSPVAAATFWVLVHLDKYNLQNRIAKTAQNMGQATEFEATYDPKAVSNQAATYLMLASLAPLVLAAYAFAIYTAARSIHSTFCAKPTATTDGTAAAAQRLLDEQNPSQSQAPTAV